MKRGIPLSLLALCMASCAGEEGVETGPSVPVEVLETLGIEDDLDPNRRLTRKAKPTVRVRASTPSSDLSFPVSSPEDTKPHLLKFLFHK